MLGYRLFKVIGSALILVLAGWLPLGENAMQLGWLTLLICCAWIVVLALLTREYHAFVNETPVPA
jgi:AAA family ATP:ADP antiporter